MVLLNLTRKPTSRLLAGLSKSLDAKEGNFCPIISPQELSTPLLTSGAESLLGTLIDDTVAELSTEGESKYLYLLPLKMCAC